MPQKPINVDDKWLDWLSEKLNKLASAELKRKIMGDMTKIRLAKNELKNTPICDDEVRLILGLSDWLMNRGYDPDKMSPSLFSSLVDIYSRKLKYGLTGKASATRQEVLK